MITVKCPVCLADRTIINRFTCGKMCRSCRAEENRKNKIKSKRSSLTGKVFGKLKVLEFSHINEKSGNSTWKCLCECGNETLVSSGKLNFGHTRSCGCTNRTQNSLSSSVGYSRWRSMMSRCYKKENPAFLRYGGRGIKVCEHWHTFENFLEDMGECPQGKSLDRIENNDSYCKENCRWSTDKEQCRNKRSNRLLTAFGETKTFTDWAEEKKIGRGTLFTRLKLGWSLEDALTKPVKLIRKREDG